MSVQLVIAAWLIDLATVWIAKRWLGGEIWFKTDNDPLFAFSLEQFAQEGWELREVTHDLHADGPVGVMTDYEAKFYDQGITINRCVAVKTEDTKCDLYPGTSTGCAPV